MPVDVIGLDYDWWFESASGSGTLAADQKPMAPDKQGLTYYARFQRAGEANEPPWVDSDGHPTPEQAMIAAEAKAPAPIVWDQATSVIASARRLAFVFRPLRNFSDPICAKLG